MEWQTPDTGPGQQPREPVEAVIVPRVRDLGDGFRVRRALPSARRLMVGPFIFFDQMGPATFKNGQGLDVRPHPHINLATITWLFAGELLHRDSLRSVQSIVPGEVNWMTAGRGIVHSERTPPDKRRARERLFGIQVWVALPRRYEETRPQFVHLGEDRVPVLEDRGFSLRLIAGTLHGVKTRVPALSPLFYGELQLERSGRFGLGNDYPERAAYVVEGEVEVDGDTFEAGQLVMFRPGAPVVLHADAPARVMLIGGELLDGPRYIWWNFVSSSRDRIEHAKHAWKNRRFLPIPDETEYIPLPADDEVASYP
ncbi:MAG: pirin family protein [Myxococcaceae bacterium]|nr:pirin family protein [Myxococcaceae bacterium]